MPLLSFLSLPPSHVLLSSGAVASAVEAWTRITAAAMLAEPLLREAESSQVLPPLQAISVAESSQVLPPLQAISVARSRAPHALRALQAVLAALASFSCVYYMAGWRTFTGASLVDLVASPATPGYWHGVSLGGWLLMEINKKQRDSKDGPDVRIGWMFDQIFASSELDFVTTLRKEKGDDFALTTMRNHWEHFIPDEALDTAKELGVDAVRIPVGYWIVDAPASGGSNTDYGFSPEGFATGGLNHLRQLLPKLRDRGMVAVVDMHALPCNSACVSDGMDCADPLGWSAVEGGTPAPIGDIERCNGAGTYPTTRRPEGDLQTWSDVGVAAIGKLAHWIAGLPEDERRVISALQLGNEPALNSPGYDQAVKGFYRAALSEARAALPSPLPLIMSFIPPNDLNVPSFIEDISNSYSTPLLIDHHWYLNWATYEGNTLSWSDMHSRACHEARNSWQPYASAGIKLIIGEWSLATNHDDPVDLADAPTRLELSRLFHEQLEVYSTDPSVVGSFYWTLRMGSGWDPRPTDQFPDGHQVDGTSVSSSLPGFRFKVWSLLEMAKHEIVTSVRHDVDASSKSSWACAFVA